MEQRAIGDWRVEQGNDGTCRGKVWIANTVTRRISELHFDAASWADVGLLMNAVAQMVAQNISPGITTAPASLAEKFKA